MIPSTRRLAGARVAGTLLLALALVYLTLFVPRGWVPHDEGTLGQSAELVLAGRIPHVDYQETYTGGLTWLYAAVFRVAGIDMLYLRWTLFAGASLTLLAMYSLTRRYLNPIPAAVATWVGLVWSFPNYFAGLPSWWLLICAVCCLWAYTRHVETGRLGYIALAGLATGLAIIAKQTGLYLFVALIMSLLYERTTALQGMARVGAAVASAALAIAILSSRLALAEMLYLLLPIIACSRVLLTASDPRAASARTDEPSAWPVLITAVVAAGVPFAIFLAPYLLRGQWASLINGLVFLPQKRLVFASVEMPTALLLLTGVPLAALVVMPLPRFIQPSATRDRVFSIVCWIGALAIAASSLYKVVAYELVWESTRAFTALLPIAICWLLISGRISDALQRRIMFACASMLAWASFVQFPFPAPIYFCYVTPLAVIAAAVAAKNSSAVQRPPLAAWAGLLLIFGVAVMNRGYIYNLGAFHAPQAFTAELNFPRAHLRVTPKDAATYHRVVAAIEEHIGQGRLVAGPDCPEVYFLTGRFTASGAFFDFFADKPLDWASAQVVVLNHRPEFSPAVASATLLEIRREFSNALFVERFEVRWR